ncbi:GDP-mannose 4,6-dehydratase [Candidatus Babeliales bacterium]|nr:GDP-mannose 4,6-dehydratase [Candidatus Babeliales bacterium]
MERQKYWKNRKVFITGATGLLGPWIIKKLCSYGARVVVLLRDLDPWSLCAQENLLEYVTVIQGDLLDYHLLLRILNEQEIETIFHLGAQAIVGHANRSPISTFKSNIEGTWNLLEACRLSPWIKEVVLASSDKAYGEQKTLPYTEDMSLQGIHPYDVSKSCTDLIAQSYAKTYKVPVAITRCGNFFGGGDLHFNRIIPGTIYSLLHHERPVIRSDGTLIRDYIYVKDVVDGYLTLAEQLQEKELAGQAFNLSTDKPLRVIDVVRAIIDRMGISDLQPIITNRASNEIPAQHLSSKKARDVLQWSPQWGFDKGIQETIIWYTDHFMQAEKKLKKYIERFGEGSHAL